MVLLGLYLALDFHGTALDNLCQCCSSVVEASVIASTVPASPLQPVPKLAGKCGVSFLDWSLLRGCAAVSWLQLPMAVGCMYVCVDILHRCKYYIIAVSTAVMVKGSSFAWFHSNCTGLLWPTPFWVWVWFDPQRYIIIH